jgi:hypothetical protein
MRLSQIKLLIALAVSMYAGSLAMAAEPAWWTRQKSDCGLDPRLAYNSWNGACPRRQSQSGAPATDNGQEEERARQLEEQARQERLEDERRQAEAERRAREAAEAQAAFIRDRDQAAGQLRGDLPGSGSELRGQSPANSTELRGSVNTDPSVVDLRHLGDRPGVVDPRAASSHPTASSGVTASKAGAETMKQDLRPFDQEIENFLMSFKVPGRWPGPLDATPLRNPLDDKSDKSAKYAERLDRALLSYAEATAVGGVGGGTTPVQAQHLRLELGADSGLTRKRFLILDKLLKQENVARDRATNQLADFIRTACRLTGVTSAKDFDARMGSDPKFSGPIVDRANVTMRAMDMRIDRLRTQSLADMRLATQAWMKTRVASQ